MYNSRSPLVVLFVQKGSCFYSVPRTWCDVPFYSVPRTCGDVPFYSVLRTWGDVPFYSVPRTWGNVPFIKTIQKLTTLDCFATF